MDKNRKVLPMPKANENSPDFVMQDLDTGAIEPADDLAQALFGKPKLDDSMFQEIKPKEKK